MNKRWLVAALCVAIGSISCMQARTKSSNRMNPMEMKLEQLNMKRDQLQQKINMLEQQNKTAEMQCEQAQGYAKGEICSYSDQEISSNIIEMNMARRQLEKVEKDIAVLQQQLPANKK